MRYFFLYKQKSHETAVINRVTMEQKQIVKLAAAAEKKLLACLQLQESAGPERTTFRELKLWKHTC